MFLLIRDSPRYQSGFASTFTFHNVSINTTVLTRLLRLQQSLHSTMFLLIQEEEKVKELHSWDFTFHNVSINTNVYADLYGLAPVFTFHNVSINTVWQAWQSSRERPLHSTMFLLIRELPRRNTLYFITLHSTMFLLIHGSDAQYARMDYHFTFHNVSINTWPPFSRSWTISVWLYIPQCFY